MEKKLQINKVKKNKQIIKTTETKEGRKEERKNEGMKILRE